LVASRTECMTSDIEKVPVAPDEKQAVFDITAALKNPHRLSQATVDCIVAESGTDKLTLRRAVAALGTVLLLAPELGRHVPVSFLDRCWQFNETAIAWPALALIMLHTDGRAQTCEWLQRVWNDGQTDDKSWRLLEHLCDWFPEQVDRALLAGMARRSRF